MFYFMYVVFLIMKWFLAFFFPLFCVESPRKSPGGISEIIVAALLSCRSGSFSFRIDNVPMCDLTCAELAVFRQFISSEMKNSNFHNNIHERNHLMNNLNDAL